MINIIFICKNINSYLIYKNIKKEEGLEIIDIIAWRLFIKEGHIFYERWQTGLFSGGYYESYTNRKTPMIVVISEKRIHIIFNGINNKNKIKGIINSKYNFIK